MTKRIITLEHVSKYINKFNVKDYILNDICLSVEKGETLFVTGSSGSGKSTLLSIVARLQNPTEGYVHVHSQEIAFLLQVGTFIKHLSIFDNMIHGLLKARKLRVNDAHSLAEDILKKFDIYHIRNLLPEEVSKGLLQYAELARCSLLEPEVLILDEPTSNMDSSLAGRAIVHINQLQSKNTTILISTHDQFFLDICDRYIELNDGCLV